MSLCFEAHPCAGNAAEGCGCCPSPSEACCTEAKQRFFGRYQLSLGGFRNNKAVFFNQPRNIEVVSANLVDFRDENGRSTSEGGT